MSAQEARADDRPPSFLALPAEALTAPREEFLYVTCLRNSTGVDTPDSLAVVDTNPDSKATDR